MIVDLNPWHREGARQRPPMLARPTVRDQRDGDSTNAPIGCPSSGSGLHPARSPVGGGAELTEAWSAVEPNVAIHCVGDFLEFAAWQLERIGSLRVLRHSIVAYAIARQRGGSHVGR